MKATILFYTISALVLFFGILTVSSRRFFRAAVYLLATLLFTAGLYFMMAFNFIAIVQIMVYVGGIVVLILFSILLTHTSTSAAERPGVVKTAGAFLFSAGGFLYTSWLLISYGFQPNPAQNPDLKITKVGTQLLNINDSGYILPFELITVLLLAAMIGSIAVAFKDKKEENPAIAEEQE